MEPVRKFANAMRAVRGKLAQAGKLHYTYQQEAWILDAADVYCGAVLALEAAIALAQPNSSAFEAFQNFLADYVSSPSFLSLRGDISTVRSQLDAIRYTLLIGNSSITVTPYLGEPDYEREIEDDFSRFQQGDVKGRAFKFAETVEMNHIQAGVLDRVVLIFPEVFSALDDFVSTHGGFLELDHRKVRPRGSVLRRLCGSHRASRRRQACSFCFPQVSQSREALHASGAFDLALANTLLGKGKSVVVNDFHLAAEERIIIVSGPNQGGKTTFARMFGQLHYLSSLGLPVPGVSARLPLFDRIFTHFEIQEDVHNLRGKLHDDLYRLRKTLSSASSRSVIILNEVFNSTSLSDAVFLSGEILRAILDLEALCVCVTFIDELALLGPQVVSMASTVNPQNVAERTFKVMRKPPDGLAYAISIAEKYRLTYRQLQERLAS